MYKTNLNKIAVIVGVILLAAVLTMGPMSVLLAQEIRSEPTSGDLIMKGSASELLEEGIYAEQTEGDLDKAMAIYTEITERHRDEERIAAKATYQLGMCYLKKGDKEKAADYFRNVVTDYPKQDDIVEQAKEQFSKIYPGREIVQRSVVTTRQTIDPAILMPANTLAYVEFGSPGKQLETILNMLRGTPMENPLTLIGGANTPGNRIGAFLNPSMLAEFKKIRGAAVGMTGTANNTPFVALVDPGDSDALRGLIMAFLGNVGKAAEPVEGMSVMTVGDQGYQAYMAYDEQVIIAAYPYEQFLWSVRQYKQVTDEPTLASQNESFSKIDRKVRSDNVVTFWADVDTLFGEIKGQFGNTGMPQEFAMADYIVDFESIDELLGYMSIKPSGFLLEANIDFKEGHRCFAYDIIRTPNISKSVLGSVPDRSAAFLSFALDESSGPAVERAQKAAQRLTGLDIGREIFANIEQVTAFVVSPQSKETAARGSTPVLPNLGIAITSHNPQQTRMLLGRILKGVELGAMSWEDMQTTGQAEDQKRFVFNIDNEKVYCQVEGLDKTTLLAFSPDVLNASLAAMKNKRVVLNSGSLGKAIAELPDDTSKVFMLNIGHAIRLASAYAPVPGGDEGLEVMSQLADAFDKTCVEVRTRERINNFNLHAGIQGIPPVDQVYGPMMQIAQLSQQAEAKAMADKARAEKGATIIKTAKEPVIDGDVDDLWDNAREYKVTNVIYSSSPSMDDLSAEFRAMWDEDNLYVLVDVTDDSFINDTGADEWWFDDSVEVYIDADNSKSNQYDDNDAQYHFDWDRTNPTMSVHEQHGRTENVEFAMITTETGYRTEIKFPWETLGTKPIPGSSIGLDIHINDDDGGGHRDVKLMWHDSGDSAWSSPQAFGNAELAGLIGFWKFDESEGNIAKDSSSGKHDGELKGDAKWTQGRVGGAIELDGDGDFVRIPDEHAFDISGEITIACWVSLQAVPYDYTAIVTKGDNSWRLSTSGRQRKFHASVSSWDQFMVDGSTEVSANQWHHVTAVYDGKKMCIYVDGKVDVCQDWTGGIGQNDYNVLIGENAQEQGRFFDGLIDDVRVYNYALSKTEIENLAQGQ